MFDSLPMVLIGIHSCDHVIVDYLWNQCQLRIVNLTPAYCEVYLIQPYVIKCVSNLQKVNCFLQVFLFSLSTKFRNKRNAYEELPASIGDLTVGNAVVLGDAHRSK